MCTVAGWGLVSQHRRTNTLRDVQLSVQRDQECSNYFDTFDGQRQICVGDQFEGKTTFLVRPLASTALPEKGGLGRTRQWEQTTSPQPVWSQTRVEWGIFPSTQFLREEEEHGTHNAYTCSVFMGKGKIP